MNFSYVALVMIIYLKEKGLGNYDDLTAQIENLSAWFDALSDSINAAKKRMVEIQALKLSQHKANLYRVPQVWI